jgi:hypothetical protein
MTVKNLPYIEIFNNRPVWKLCASHTDEEDAKWVGTQFLVIPLHYVI